MRVLSRWEQAPFTDLGDHARALEWAQRALSMAPEEAAILYNVACAYALLGEMDKSIDFLEKAFRQGYSHKVWMEKDPALFFRSRPSTFQGLDAEPLTLIALTNWRRNVL
jgi:tetratricopeptide (TPR) repeat protein